MSHLIARILLTILIFPATVLFFCVTFLFIERTLIPDDETSIFVTSLSSAGFMIGYWFLLWRRTVKWTPRRLKWTLVGLVAAVAAGSSIAAGLYALLPWERWIAGFFGIACGSVVWIITTIFAWRDSPAERAQRVSRAGADALVCPACGYNLTGLRESRCPECGAQFTLNELFAAQPSRAPAEIEAAG